MTANPEKAVSQYMIRQQGARVVLEVTGKGAKDRASLLMRSLPRNFTNGGSLQAANISRGLWYERAKHS